MSKEITFMRKDLFSKDEMDKAIDFLKPLFENDAERFKKMLEEGTAYIEGKSFTYIRNHEAETVSVRWCMSGTFFL
jgi:hypothetical protein